MNELDIPDQRIKRLESGLIAVCVLLFLMLWVGSFFCLWVKDRLNDIEKTTEETHSRIERLEQQNFERMEQ